MARPTLENRDAIERARSHLLHAAGLLQDVLDGKVYQTEVAETLGISSMQHTLSEGFEPYIRSTVLGIDNIGQELNRHMTAEEKILLNTFMPEDPWIFGSDGRLRILPQYDENALHDAIDNELTEKEAKILRIQCGCDPEFSGSDLTLDDMGSAIGVTKERVRQIRDRAYEKLRRPDVQAKIFAPAFETLRVETDCLISSLKELQTEYRRAKDEYNELLIRMKAIDAAKADGVSGTLRQSAPSDTGDPLRDAADARIPDPDLSFRSNHWLQEAGYLTLMDVYRAGSDKLSQVRGLGAKSVAELTCLFRDRYHVTLPKAETRN